LPMGSGQAAGQQVLTNPIGAKFDAVVPVKAMANAAEAASFSLSNLIKGSAFSQGLRMGSSALAGSELSRDFSVSQLARGMTALEVVNTAKSSRHGDHTRSFPGGPIAVGNALGDSEAASMLAQAKVSSFFGYDELLDTKYRENLKNLFPLSNDEKSQFQMANKFMNRFSKKLVDEKEVISFLTNPQAYLSSMGGINKISHDPKTGKYYFETGLGYCFVDGDFIQAPSFISASVRGSAKYLSEELFTRSIVNDKSYSLSFKTDFFKGLEGKIGNEIKHIYSTELAKIISKDHSLSRVYKELVKAGIGGEGSITFGGPASLVLELIGLKYARFRDERSEKAITIEVNEKEMQALQKADKEAFAKTISTTLTDESGRKYLKSYLETMNTIEAKNLLNRIGEYEKINNILQADFTPALLNRYKSLKAAEFKSQYGREATPEELLNLVGEDISKMVATGDYSKLFNALGINSTSSFDDYLRAIKNLSSQGEIQERLLQEKVEILRENEELKREVTEKTKHAYDLRGTPNFIPGAIPGPPAIPFKPTYTPEQIKQILNNAPSFIYRDGATLFNFFKECCYYFSYIP
ncbi:hypothetical protein, partial [Caldisericum sp.]|uniref:hypothetical protein n=1 Tax=Caldisericum sp. TaxID=2499687 RepID=UPI003D0F5662